MKKIILPPLILFLALLLVLLSACTYPMGSDLIETREYKIANIKDKVKIGKEEKEIAYTDENDGEGMIIKTDRNSHFTMGGDVMSWSSKTNLSEPQWYYLVASFGDGVGENGQYLRSLEMFMGNEVKEELITATTSEHTEYYEEAIWETLEPVKFDFKSLDIKRKDTKGRIPDKVYKVYFNEDETKYFRSVIRIPLKAENDEWFWEGFGEKGAYGNLDPNNFVFEDKLNSDTKSTGDLNGQDAWSGHASFDVVTSGSPPSYEGDQLLENKATADAYDISASFSAIVSGTYCYSMRGAKNTGNFPKTYIKTNTSNFAAGAKFSSDGTIRETRSGTQVGSHTYSANTWYRLCMAFETGAGAWEGLSADTVKISVDDGTLEGPFTLYASANATGIFLQGYAPSADYNYWDYFSYEYGGAAPPVVTPVSEESDWIIYN